MAGGMETSATLDSKEVEEFLKNVKGNIDSFMANDVKIWRAMAVEAFADVQDHFLKEQGPGGKKWDSYSQSYLAAIQGLIHFRKIKNRTVALKGPDPVRIPKMGSVGKILQDTGRLRNSVTMARSKSRTKKGILLFNNAKTKSGFPYAQHHDEGPSSHKGNPRTYMWLSNKAFNTIATMAAAYMRDNKED